MVVYEGTWEYMEVLPNLIPHRLSSTLSLPRRPPKACRPLKKQQTSNDIKTNTRVNQKQQMPKTSKIQKTIQPKSRGPEGSARWVGLD